MTIVNEKRIKLYVGIAKEMLALIQHKRNLEKYCQLKGVDYSRIKVTAGNGRKTSEEERRGMLLQQINKRLSEYRAWIVPEHVEILTQINRLDSPRYRAILKMYYFQRAKFKTWKDITFRFFGAAGDYDENYENYKRMVMYWRKRALLELETISAKPYIPAAQDKQLTINLTPSTGGLER